MANGFRFRLLIILLLLLAAEGIRFPARLVNRHGSFHTNGRQGESFGGDGSNSTALSAETNSTEISISSAARLGKVWGNITPKWLKHALEKFFIGVRYVAYDKVLEENLRFQLLPQIASGLFLPPLLNRASPQQRRGLSNLLYSLSKWVKSPSVLDCMALTAWGIQLQKRWNRGIEALFLPFLSFLLLDRLSDTLYYALARKNPLWSSIIIAPFFEELQHRFLPSSIQAVGISNETKVVAGETIKQTNLTTNETSVEKLTSRQQQQQRTNPWQVCASATFGLAHIHHRYPPVDEQAVADRAHRVLMILNNNTWHGGLYHQLFSHFKGVEMEMNGEQMEEAMAHSTTACLSSLQLFLPMFENHGFWAAFGAHATANAIASRRVKDSLGIFRVLHGAFRGENCLTPDMLAMAYLKACIFFKGKVKKVGRDTGISLLLYLLAKLVQRG